MSDDLKSCPFCGSPAQMVSGAPDCHYIRCNNCSVATSDGNQRRVRAQWNRRTPPPGYVLIPEEPTDAMLDAAVKLALRVTLSGDYTWPDYMADLYRAMIAAAGDKGDE